MQGQHALTRVRHGHLMLYDDIQQLEVRYVISLEYHDIDIYGGGEEIPESELWIKRNAIRLRRKQVQIGDKNSSLPFFLFSENCSEKEDFYFALLSNVQKSSGDNLPVPQEFETHHIISLVQGLHSSEEQLQTRWLNALIGRLFLAVYKTPELEALIRQKLTKKISRVKKPDFITKLALQKIDTGTGAPFITNPRLKDLTVNGDCTVEADMEYSGGFRIEIAATVRIDLGKRLGAREVDIVLAATLKKLQGHLLLRLKPPPSNRLWMSFEKVPKIEMKLEPIVSSRQITYGVILRAIESRIIEVLAETLVLPFWDDTPFAHTEGETFRGGIWKKDVKQAESTEIKDEVAEDEAEAGAGSGTPDLVSKDERVMSMPVLADASAATAAARKSFTSLKQATAEAGDGAKTPERTTHQAPPRIMRSSSFASAADPMVSPSHAPAESAPIDIKATSKRDTMLKDISTRSLGTSPEEEYQSPPKENQTALERNHARTDSIASDLSSGSIKAPRRGTGDTDSTLSTRTMSDVNSEKSNSKRSSFHFDGKGGIAAAAKNFANADHQKAMASINAARDAAQKWGWGVLARNRQRNGEPKTPGEQEHTIDTSQPMGRGQPLPPPGQPLPRPPKPSMFSLAKRKSVSTPSTPNDAETPSSTKTPQDSPPKAPPPLPDRKRRQSYMQNTDQQHDELLVVEAPHESAPTSPLSLENEHHDEFFGHGEDLQDSGDKFQAPPEEIQVGKAPPLPSRAKGVEGRDLGE